VSTAFAIGCLTISVAFLGLAVKAWLGASVDVDW
jgi:hypothetical protein